MLNEVHLSGTVKRRFSENPGSFERSSSSEFKISFRLALCTKNMCMHTEEERRITLFPSHLKAISIPFRIIKWFKHKPISFATRTSMSEHSSSIN